MSDDTREAALGCLIVLVIVALVAGGVWYTFFQYDLCRAEGMGFWYCVRHAGIL